MDTRLNLDDGIIKQAMLLTYPLPTSIVLNIFDVVSH